MEDNQSSQESTTQTQPAPEKVKIEFVGSERIRAKIPQAFELAESVATEWKNDGKFEALPVGHPILQVVASEGLKRAKNLEKKAKDLEQKASFFAQMGIELVKSKLKKKD